MNRNSVGTKDIYSVKSALTIRGKLYGWTTRWVNTGKSFNVIDTDGNIIARWGL